MACEPVDLFRWERLAAKRPEEFLAEWIAVDDKDGVISSLRILKASGICVDLFLSGTTASLYGQCIDYLATKYGAHNEQLERFSSEVDILQGLVSEFYEFRQASGLEALSKKRQLPAYLLALEIFLGSGLEYRDDIPPEEIKSRYPFIIVLANNRELVRAEDHLHHINNALDVVAESARFVLPYFRNVGVDFSGLKLTVSSEHLRLARTHIYMSINWSILKDSIDLWKFHDFRVERLPDNIILVRPDEEDKLLPCMVSNHRFEDLKFTWARQDLEYGAPIEDNTTQILPPRGFRSQLERFSSTLCEHTFGSDDLSEEYLGVNLAEWIRAYTLLNELGKARLADRREVAPLSLEKWCIGKTSEEWCSTLVQGGIPPEKAQLVVEAMTYGPKSEDLLDCPFVKIADRSVETLIALPSMLAIAEPSSVLFSNMLRKKQDLAAKGDGFEKRLLGELRTAGIPAEGLYKKDGTEEYECDVAFPIGSTLFLGECKALVQPHDFRDHARVRRNLWEATQQLQRTATFYGTNLDLVRTQLGLPADWTPDQVVQFVVCTPMMGDRMQVGGCFVVDESAFVTFLHRDPPGYMLGKVKLTFPDPAFEGEITGAKLVAFLSNPANPALKRERFHTFFSEVKLLKSTLKRHTADEKLPVFSKLTDADIQRFADALGLSFDELRSLMEGQQSGEDHKEV